MSKVVLKKKETKENYLKFFTIAVVLHLALAATLLIKYHGQVTVIQPAAEPEIVQAVAVNQKDLNQELARIKKTDNTKRDKELEKQRKAERKLEEAQKKAQKEQERLAALQEKREQAEKQQLKDEAAQKKLAAEQAKAEKQKLEEVQKKLAQEKTKLEETQKKNEEAQKQAAEQAEQQAKQKQEQEQQQAAADAAKKKQRETYVSSLISKYTTLVNQKISRNWMVQEQRAGIFCRLFVRVAPGGMVLDVQVQESSGSDAFDRSAVQAVYKASPLPVPTEEDAFEPFRELRLTLRPEDIISTGG